MFNMQKSQEIIKNMIEECPFVISPSLEPYISEAMKLYANAKLDEAAEKVEMTYHCGHTKNNTPTKYHQSGADNIQINKQSILSLKDEI